MDVYTTSFTYPRSRHSPSLGSSNSLSKQRSFDVHSHHSSTDGSFSFPAPSQQQLTNGGSGANDSHAAATAHDAEVVQSITMAILRLPGCHVSFAVADRGHGWNFLISGAYQSCMSARGVILKDCPIQVRQNIPLPQAIALIAGPRFYFFSDTRDN